MTVEICVDGRIVTLTAEEWAARNPAILPETAPVPESVYDYQFAGEAEARGFITLDECDAWVGAGEIPPTLENKVRQLIPAAAEQRRVILFLKGSKEFPRYHDHTVKLAALFGLTTGAELDGYFVAAKRR